MRKKTIIRFKQETVLRICMNCQTVLGCYCSTIIANCLECQKNCLFRSLKMSLKGFRLLSNLDTGTSDVCKNCFLVAVQEIETTEIKPKFAIKE